MSPNKSTLNFDGTSRAPDEANRIAVAIASEGEHERSLSLFEPLVERFPDSAALWVNLAVAYDELGRRDEALQALERALELDPEDPEAIKLKELFDAP